MMTPREITSPATSGMTNRNLAILYIVVNDHAPVKDEPQSRNIV